MPGQLVFPTPNAFRSPFRKSDGTYDWEAEMTYGWDLIDRKDLLFSSRFTVSSLPALPAGQTVGQLAAFIVEPILSTGGILELPLGYLKRLSLECKVNKTSYYYLTS